MDELDVLDDGSTEAQFSGPRDKQNYVVRIKSRYTPSDRKDGKCDFSSPKVLSGALS